MFLSVLRSLQWNNLDSNLCNSKHFDIFVNNIHKLIRPKPNSFFNCCKGIRLHLKSFTWAQIQVQFPKLFKIHFVFVVQVLNRPLIFFFTVLYLIKERYTLLSIPLWNLVPNKPIQICWVRWRCFCSSLDWKISFLGKFDLKR